MKEERSWLYRIKSIVLCVHTQESDRRGDLQITEGVCENEFILRLPAYTIQRIDRWI